MGRGKEADDGYGTAVCYDRASAAFWTPLLVVIKFERKIFIFNWFFQLSSGLRRRLLTYSPTLQRVDQLTRCCCLAQHRQMWLFTWVSHTICKIGSKIREYDAFECLSDRVQPIPRSGDRRCVRALDSVLLGRWLQWYLGNWQLHMPTKLSCFG